MKLISCTLWAVILVFMSRQDLVDSVVKEKWEDVGEKDIELFSTYFKESNILNPVAATKDNNTEGDIKATTQHKVVSEDDKRLVVFQFTLGRCVSHFFVASIVVDGKLVVTRLGHFWNAKTSWDEKNDTEAKAKLEAELYLDWAPFPFQEKWVLPNVGQMEDEYELKMIWNINETSKIGIFGRGAVSPEIDFSYKFAIGPKDQTAFDHDGPAASLPEVEAHLARILAEANPYFDPPWRTKGEILSIDESINCIIDIQQKLSAKRKLLSVLYSEKNVESLRQEAAGQIGLTKEERKDLYLQHLKFVTSKLPEGLVALFGYNNSEGNQTQIMVAGVAENGVMRMTLFKYLPRGVLYNDLLKNHYTLAFTSDILPENEGWNWPWNYKTPNNRLIKVKTRKKISEMAPFSLPPNDNIYIQKLQAKDDRTVCVFGYNSRYFVVAVDNTNGNVQVGGLKFSDQLNAETDKWLQGAYNLDVIPKTVEEKLEKIFETIKERLQEAKFRWEELKILDNSKTAWIDECRYIPTPIQPRNRKSRLDWYQIICKAPIWDTECKEFVTRYFGVLVVISEKIDVMIPGANTYWKESLTARNNFVNCLRPEHDKAFYQSRMLLESI